MLSDPEKKLPKRRRRTLRHSLKQDRLCWICGHKMLDPSMGMTNSMTATIDHIKPLSKGGSKAIKNEKAAHALCNNIRGSDDPDREKLFAKVMADPRVQKMIETLEHNLAMHASGAVQPKMLRPSRVASFQGDTPLELSLRLINLEAPGEVPGSAVFVSEVFGR